MKTNRDVIAEGLKAIGREVVVRLLPVLGDVSYRSYLDASAQHNCAAEALGGSRWWAATPQGAMFWRRVFNEIKENESSAISSMDPQTEMEARDEATEPPAAAKPAPSEPQHWTARVAPIGITNPNFFSFLRR